MRSRPEDYLEPEDEQYFDRFDVLQMPEIATNYAHSLLDTLRSQLKGTEIMMDLLIPELSKLDPKSSQRIININTKLYSAYQQSINAVEKADSLFHGINVMDRVHRRELPFHASMSISEALISLERIILPGPKDSEENKDFKRLIACINAYQKRSRPKHL